MATPRPERTPGTDIERDLAWRALSLPERLLAVAGSTAATGAPGDADVAPWSAALGSDDALRRRVAWAAAVDRDPLAIARAAMANDLPPGVAIEVGWLPTFRAIQRALASGAPAAPPTAAAALPFVDVWATLLPLVRTRLDAATPTAPHAVLRDALELALLQRLCALGAAPLYREFGIGRPAGARLDALSNEPPRARYQAFVAAIAADGGTRLFHRYPVLARLAAVTLDHWVHFAAGLERRLRDDDAALAACFGRSEATGTAGTIVAAEVGLSDPHAGHATVCRLRFDSGIDVACKPRGIELEAALERVLDALRDAGVDAPAAARTLPRDGYGYVEWIPHRPCESPADRHRFYHRAGVLLAVLHALRGTDVHHENLVACGDRPVLVDAETLVQPEFRPFADDAGDGASPYSVLRTGMLPAWEPDASGASQDISALGAVRTLAAPPAMAWRAVNTDAMHPVMEVPATAMAAASAPPGNAPWLHGVPPVPGDHAGAVDAGFAAAATALRRMAPEWAPGGRFDLPSGARARVVMRGTRVYGALLHASTTADALRDGVRRSLLFEPMLRPFLRLEAPPPQWPLALAEQREIFDLDVPYFTASMRGRTVAARDGARAEVLAEAPLEAARAGLAALDDADVALQRALLRGALAAREATARAAAPPHAQGTASARATGATPDDGALEPLAIARDIAARLAAAAHPDGRDGLFWLGPRFDPRQERFTFHEVGESLYEGRLGIALFLAGCDAAVGTREFEEPVRGALAGIERYLAVAGGTQSEWFARRLGIGGAFGVGSLVRGFTLLAAITGDDRHLEQASRAARLITAERIAGDATLDVVGGSAGALLALLDLFEISGDRDALEAATACGRHLLATARDLGSGCVGWLTIAAQPLAGAAHGSAGIAVALARLAPKVDLPRALEAAAGALRHERQLRDEASGGWRDLRDGSPPGSVAAGWCAGSAGIALTRLALAAEPAMAGDATMVADDLDRALAHAAAAPDAGVDAPCCGEAGRIEALVTGSALPGRMALMEAARARAGAIHQRAHDTGHFRCLPGLDEHLVHPGLYQGVSGIGWTMLRLAGAVPMSPLQFSSPASWHRRHGPRTPHPHTIAEGAVP